MDLNNVKIAVIGLGYVGLPLAVEFSKKYPTIGFDINQKRVNELQGGHDHTLEVEDEELLQAVELKYSSNPSDLEDANVYIVTVPTPINKFKQPDLTPLINASKTIGNNLKTGDIVIYESTVYPGATEEDCVPVLEKFSGLIFNRDFFAGYSPERINPGDKEHRVTTILKVTSGSTPDVADFVDSLYASIITAGTHKAESIKVAEAAKIIENVQRDVNIALINELFQIFERLNINTRSVIDAASTKWNFMRLTPGLVGGHCIGVDPYYLLHKANQVGYIPDLMRTAREINDSLSDFIVHDFIGKVTKRGLNLPKLKIYILGFAFKENCPDIRNTKVIDLYRQLKNYGLSVQVFDPVVDKIEVSSIYDFNLVNKSNIEADGVAILAVGHEQILSSIKNKTLNFQYIHDFKGLLGK